MSKIELLPHCAYFRLGIGTRVVYSKFHPLELESKPFRLISGVLRIRCEVVQVGNHTGNQEECHRCCNDKHKGSHFFGGVTIRRAGLRGNTGNTVFSLVYMTNYELVACGR